MFGLLARTPDRLGKFGREAISLSSTSNTTSRFCLSCDAMLNLSMPDVVCHPSLLIMHYVLYIEVVVLP